MSNQLNRTTSGGSWLTQRAANQDLVRRGLEVRNETQLASFKTDAIGAVTEKAMETIAELNQMRRVLLGDDPAVNAIHAETMMIGVFNIQRVQRRHGFTVSEQ